MVILQNPNNVEPDLTETPRFSEDLDSACSTPYVSAPSSPGRGPLTAGYFFSAPASPMHYVLSSGPSATCHSSESSLLSTQSDFEFDFSSRFSSNGSVAVGSMSSADELFLNGQIRPMKLSSHLQRPQILAPLIDLDVEEDDHVNKGDGEETAKRGRDLKLRSRSLHRKARSLSPLRNQEFEWHEEDIDTGRDVSEKILELQDYVDRKESEAAVSSETTPSCSASSSRSSSSGRNSKKWIFLKDLLYRSKSEGRGNGKEKFWSSISFSPSKEKKLASTSLTLSKEDKSSPPDASSNETQEKPKQKQKQKQKRNEQSSVKKTVTGKPANGISKRRVPRSAHELHYTANRAQAEEMKKRTYLPYRQGLFGCLGFSSKGYGALNGLAKTLNPVSSRMDAGGGA
ncbi:Calmodulin-binding protein [Melia azedarach]|uniref:Calmodulin-binding protein n=1 Tax=Melia azedarach TaxID=155640 RepID=A0ACC1YX38_MELAZ|nr:Calmodulin-binding protein [Melia azedarach]